MARAVSQLAETFAVAFGVVVGGALVGALAALFTGGFPGEALVQLADRLKVWGAAAALGGSFVSLRSLEAGLFRLEVHLLLREIVSLAVAFAGCLAAYYLLLALVGRLP